MRTGRHSRAWTSGTKMPARDELARQARLRIRPEPSSVPMDRRPAVMRAPSAVEKINDWLRGLYESAAKQPVGQVADALGVTGLAGMASTAPSDPMLLSEVSGKAKGIPIVPARLERGLTGDAGYAYHATNIENLHDIARAGKLKTFGPSHGTDQSMWPDRSVEKRAYFSATPENSYQFAPEDGQAVVVRTRRDGRIFTESTGDLFARKPISADALEFLGQDQQWYPIQALKEGQ